MDASPKSLLVLAAKITAKGQVTIPAAVRKALRLGPGDRIAFSQGPDGAFSLTRPAHRVNDLFGCLSAYKAERPLTRDDIDDAVNEAMTERRKGGLEGGV